ncbi:MAG: hypothetical protein FWH32_06615 [Clostridiales bacterium]|nr:hypothetical protein [Clostridiales bacterium]
MGELEQEELHREERDEAALAAARAQVYAVFDELGIPYEVADHPPIYSAADRIRQDVQVDALICKNLFLRNKEKSRHYLYALPIDKRADLAALQKILGESRLSFGDADALWDCLRIRPGSVSLLNIIGAREAGQGVENPVLLKFLVDADVLAVPRIGLHPNDNAATIMFEAARLAELFRHYRADFEFV